MIIFKNEGMYAVKPPKRRSYWTEVHHILHDVARSSQMNLLQETQLKLAVADRTKPEVEIWRRPKKSTVSYLLLQTLFR